MRSREIKTQGDNGLHVGGWLSGETTYLWIGAKDVDHPENEPTFVGTLGGYKLYRLAKAIVRQFEAKNA